MSHDCIKVQYPDSYCIFIVTYLHVYRPEWRAAVWQILSPEPTHFHLLVIKYTVSDQDWFAKKIKNLNQKILVLVWLYTCIPSHQTCLEEVAATVTYAGSASDFSQRSWFLDNSEGQWRLCLDHNHPGHGLHLARTLNPESSSATKIVHCQVSGGNKFILFFNSFIELITIFHPLNSNSLV